MVSPCEEWVLCSTTLACAAFVGSRMARVKASIFRWIFMGFSSFCIKKYRVACP